MSTDIKHAKLTRVTPVDQTTSNIRIENYTNSLKSETIRTEKKIRATELTLLAKHIECLDVIKQGVTTELDLNIRRDQDGTIRITKTWTTKKEQYS